MAAGQPMKTYGEKPKAFSFDEGGEKYYIGSEVELYIFLNNLS